MDIIFWIIVGFLAGAISSALVSGRSARGCLPNIIVGVLGGLLGRWLADQMGFGPVTGFVATLVVAIIGAIIIRFVLEALSGRQRA